MNTQLIVNILFNILIMIPTSILTFYAIQYLIDYKVSKKRLVVTAFIMAIAISIPGTLLTVLDENRIMTLESELLIAITNLLVSVLVVSLSLKKKSLHLIGAVLLTHFFYESLISVSTFILFDILNIKDIDSHYVYLILSYIILPLLFLTLLKILRKVNFNRFFIGYFKHTLSAIILSIILVFLALSPIIITHSFPAITKNYPYLLASIQLVIVVSVLFYIAFYLNAKERVEAQEALLIEQESYLHTLEQIQKEMRVFQHDYKNMLSALYLYAENGDTENIQEYIGESVINIDKNLAEKIRKTTNLANIQITELKSLILTKLILMEQRNLNFELEVMNRIDKISMDTPDLVRSLGILLDNAIEACTKGDVIKLLLSNEDDSLLIVISNPIKTNPSVTEIWSDGFSTKGKGRGLGLYSYQKIISKYPNAFKQLIIKDNTFSQILRIEHR